MERFWIKTRPDDSGCILWTAAKDEWGYGRFLFKGKNRHAHRVAYEITHGEIPGALVVMHKCDNPACVNPEHLMLGTHADNVADMDRKGRANRTPTRHQKMTRDQAQEARSSPLSAQCLAARFGVSVSAIYQIRAGTTWK